MQLLLKNDVFDGIDGCTYRVISPSRVPNCGWVINLSQAHQWPVERDFGVLRNHKASAGQRQTHTLPEFAFYSEKARARAREAYDAIKPLLFNPDGSENREIFDDTTRSRLVRARADELGISKTTLYGYLNKWWTLGQSRYALLPGSALNGKKQAAGTVGRGRTPEDSRYAIFQMGPDDIKWAKDIIRRQYIKREHTSLENIHNDLLKERYSSVDGNGSSFLLPEGERPSIYQFRHVLKKHFTPEQVRRGKKGDKNFDRENKPMVGSALEECAGVGHIYEIDATILDVFLVSIANRAHIIGKPTLYLIYDRKSRLCVGFYIGLENASWTGAMLAILSIAADKRALCNKYGIPYDPADWPADGIFPAKFLGDRGEMASRNSDRICEGMESTISNTQALLPIGKGLVECGFMKTHADIKDVAPGYEPPMNAIKRRAKKYHLDAALTLDECASLILSAIIKHNKYVMDDYPLSPDYVLAGCTASPKAIWEHDIVSNSGSVSRYTYDYLHRQLLPQGEATVTQDGIRFRNCFYYCANETVRQWVIQAGMGASFKVRCSYDLRLIDNIIVYGLDGSSFTCSLTGDSKRYIGYSFAEVGYIEKRKRLANKDQESAKAQAKADHRAHSKAVSGHAVKSTRQSVKAANLGTRSARRKDTAPAREAEKKARRQDETRLPSVDNGSNVIPMHSPRTTAVDTGSMEQVSIPPLNNTPAPKRSAVQNMLHHKYLEKSNEPVHR